MGERVAHRWRVYCDGGAAYVRGEALDANPWMALTDFWFAWSDGWRFAAEHMRRAETTVLEGEKP